MKKNKGKGIKTEIESMDVVSPLSNPWCWGHDEALALLSRQDQTSKAWLVAGPRGVGKRTVCYAAMRRLAQGSHDSELMNPSHPLFVRMAAGSLPYVAVWERQALSQQGVSLDIVRSIRKFFSMTHQGPCRLLLLDSAHQLSVQALNALLKSIEELPPRTHFFLTTLNAGSLLPTVRSRCHLITLQPATPEVFTQAVKQMEAEVPDDLLTLSLVASRGCIGMGLRIIRSLKLQGIEPGKLQEDFYKVFLGAGDSENYFASLLKDDMIYGIWSYLLRDFLHKGLKENASPNSKGLFQTRPLWQWLEVERAVERLINEGSGYHMNPLHAFFELQRLCKG